jgi:hypothetical protein
MSDPQVRSTVGTPTPDNAGEIIELTYDLGLISKAKRNLTAAGQALQGLREKESNNDPFVIGAEGLMYMRQVVERDGQMLKPFAMALSKEQAPIARSEFAMQRFPEVVAALVNEVDGRRARLEERRAARQFRDLIIDTQRKAAQKEREQVRRGEAVTRGPGVLEHRSSPRFEWLCDLRVLSKEGLGTNEFKYMTTPDLDVLVECLDDAPGLDSGLTRWRWRGGGVRRVSLLIDCRARRLASNRHCCWDIASCDGRWDLRLCENLSCLRVSSRAANRHYRKCGMP